ncbi:MAG: hydroxyisourate hydrolase [Firmicutes bacterium]|nr:hydroxyisourate hydrolase [Bacillota bacterium]
MAALTVHVLDWMRGLPAQGMEVRLYRTLSEGESRLLASATTDELGRLAQPLCNETANISGDFELRFDVGGYFAQRGEFQGLWRQVPIAFHLNGDEGDIHIPLLVTPWGYTTYRGS